MRRTGLRDDENGPRDEKNGAHWSRSGCSRAASKRPVRVPALGADMHAFAMQNIFPRLGEIRSTAEVLAALGEGS